GVGPGTPRSTTTSSAGRAVCVRGAAGRGRPALYHGGCGREASRAVRVPEQEGERRRPDETLDEEGADLDPALRRPREPQRCDDGEDVEDEEHGGGDVAVVRGASPPRDAPQGDLGQQQ